MSDQLTVGIFLTNQHPTGTDLESALAGQVRMARQASEDGWDSVWTGQHHLSSFAQLQPMPFLARLAAEVGDLHIGLGINLLALHNPVQIAEEIVSLDIITGGRFVYGAGLGYRDVEYQAFGVESQRKVERFERNLEIVRALLAGEEVSVDVPWCRLESARLAALPIQQPGPPMWLAANSDAAVGRAARLGDAWLINPHARLDTIRRQLAWFRAEREASGRALASVPAIKEVYCARSRDEAWELAAPYLAGKYHAYADWGQDKVMPERESFRMPFEELADTRFVLGSPQECFEQLLPWREELGVNCFIVRTHWPGMPVDSSLASMRLLASEVFPALREVKPWARE